VENELLDGKIKEAADLILRSRNVVAFTGAGISTESGIPDFRSPGGIWSRFDPADFTIEKFLNDRESRKKQWKFLLHGGFFTDARPNRAHLALAKLEKMGMLQGVITQNVDNLHQMAGNSPEKVFELHGNMGRVRCMNCNRLSPVGEIVRRVGEGEETPECLHCSGILKPDVVLFGESLPGAVLSAAISHASRCDLLLVIGSSLVVYPAAYVPAYALEGGAKLVIINLTATGCDIDASVVIHGKAGEVMERILTAIENMREIADPL
jgi:NAD-dependent deacetylase